jgi:hypothetical protein
MIKSNLEQEIVKHIMGNFGIVPPPYFGKVGISLNNFSIKKRLIVNSDDKKIEFPLWCCQLNSNIDMGSYRLLLADMYEPNSSYYEYILCIKHKNNNTIALKSFYNCDLSNFFLIKKDKWQQVKLSKQLIFCSGIEELTQKGLINFEKCNDYDDLFESLIEIVEL